MTPRRTPAAALALALGLLAAPAARAGVVIVSNFGAPADGNIGAAHAVIAGRFTLDPGPTRWDLEVVTLLLDARNRSRVGGDKRAAGKRGPSDGRP